MNQLTKAFVSTLQIKATRFPTLHLLFAAFLIIQSTVLKLIYSLAKHNTLHLLVYIFLAIFAILLNLEMGKSYLYSCRRRLLAGYKVSLYFPTAIICMMWLFVFNYFANSARILFFVNSLKLQAELVGAIIPVFLLILLLTLNHLFALVLGVVELYGKSLID
jgi:hypothetical protein